MAHNINFNERTGRYSFFSVQQKAWHGLGQIVEQYPTSEEAIRHAVHLVPKEINGFYGRFAFFHNHIL